jgi:hypothetical protein
MSNNTKNQTNQSNTAINNLGITQNVNSSATQNVK